MIWKNREIPIIFFLFHGKTKPFFNIPVEFADLLVDIIEVKEPEPVVMEEEMTD